MPYEYRKLTEEERQEVLRQRAERGYPLHAPPHPFRSQGYYLITAANFDHAAVMESPVRKTDFENRMLTCLHQIHAEISGWVILPNHYHFLVGVESFEDISSACKQIHGATSRDWNQADQLTGKRQVWYKFSDRKIRNEGHFYQALNYIHFNPVKHGYVSDPYEWLWTSLPAYLEEYGREWLREKWAAYKPGDFGAGWDE